MTVSSVDPVMLILHVSLRRLFCWSCFNVGLSAGGSTSGSSVRYACPLRSRKAARHSAPARTRSKLKTKPATPAPPTDKVAKQAKNVALSSRKIEQVMLPERPALASGRATGTRFYSGHVTQAYGDLKILKAF